MTLEELQDVLAEIPSDIPVSRFENISEKSPRIIWNETGMDQVYSSNEANDLSVRVVVELIAYPADTHRVWDVVRLFRSHRIPFSCACGWDADNQYASYEFSIMISEAFADDE